MDTISRIWRLKEIRTLNHLKEIRTLNHKSFLQNLHNVFNLTFGIMIMTTIQNIWRVKEIKFSKYQPGWKSWCHEKQNLQFCNGKN